MNNNDISKSAQYLSSMHYKRLFENNHTIMLIIDPDTGDIIDANSAACSFYGYTYDHLLGMKISHINILDESQNFLEMNAAKKNYRNQFIFKHKLSNGQVRYVEVHSGPIDLEGKQLLYSIVHDVSEQQSGEAALKEQMRFENAPGAHNLLMNTILENIKVGIFLIEAPNGKVLFINDYAKQLTGRNMISDISREGVSAYFEPFELGTGQPYPYEKMPIARSLKGENSYIDDMIIIQPNGKKLVIEMYGMPVKDRDGKFMFTIVNFNDISERKHVENKIKMLNEQLSMTNKSQENKIAELEETNAILDEEVQAYKKANDRLKKMLASRTSSPDTVMGNE